MQELTRRNADSGISIFIFPLKIWRKGKKFVNSLEERKLCCTFAIESNTKQYRKMETTIRRKPTSFRLRGDIIEGLKRNAARENRTLNNYVESVLMDVVYGEPNEVTKAAIREAMSGKNPNKVYSGVKEMFDDIMNEE